MNATEVLDGCCLCQRTRFRVRGAPAHVSYCHCRMCRKATGGPYSVMATFPGNAITWHSAPAWRRSSPLAQRAFCAECGSPLGFKYDDSDFVSIPLGAFDDAERLIPMHHGSIETKLSWVRVDDHLPSERCDDDPDYRKLVAETGWTPPFDPQEEPRA